MNFNNKILNDLISKDFKLAKASCEKLINDNIFNAWEELTQKSEFIFDFIKEKINKNLINSINQSNFKNIFDFMKIYSEDFEDFILNSLLKFANEDLSDELLELLENGTIAEKCWATLYFSHILDPLSLEIIEDNLSTEDENLKYLTIKALKAHGAVEMLEEAKEKLLSSHSETAYEGFQFIISWQDKNSFENLYEYLKNSDYKVPLSLDMIYFIGLEEIAQEYGFEKSNYIFNLLLDGIPEIINPNEYLLEEISNYINLILKQNNQKNFAPTMLEAKIKFNLMAQNDSYTFDLDKNTKNKLKEVENLINSISDSKWREYESYLGTYLESEYVFEVLEIIKEKELINYTKEIMNLLNKTNDDAIICKCCEILKDFQNLNEVDKEAILENVHSDSAKALISSYFEKN